MYVPEINEVKDVLETFHEEELIQSWDLPYENLLTRLSAAIFFISPKDEEAMNQICSELTKYPNFSYRLNEEKQLSDLDYRVTFSLEEKEKNQRNTSKVLL